VPEEPKTRALEGKLFAPAGPRSKSPPGLEHIDTELRRRGVTLALLREEYGGHHHDGYGYSRFRDLYVEWRHGITATIFVAVLGASNYTFAPARFSEAAASRYEPGVNRT
jgi:transposase